MSLTCRLQLIAFESAECFRTPTSIAIFRIGIAAPLALQALSTDAYVYKINAQIICKVPPKQLTRTVDIVNEFCVKKSHLFGAHCCDVFEFFRHNRKVGYAHSVRDCVIVHQRAVVIGHASIRHLPNAKRLQHRSKRHKRCGRFVEHIFPVDCDVLVAIGALMRMPEAERVAGLVRNHVFLQVFHIFT